MLNRLPDEGQILAFSLLKAMPGVINSPIEVTGSCQLASLIFRGSELSLCN